MQNQQTSRWIDSSPMQKLKWRGLTRLSRSRWVSNLASGLVLLLGWQLLITLGGYKRFILPAPLDVWQEFLIVVADGRLLRHTLITLSEIVTGALIGCTIAAVLGYVLAKSPLAERLVGPYLVASQAIPIIAIAPLLSLWIPSTYWSRVLVAVLVVFFPVLVNVITGLREISAELYHLMHALRASRWQTFTLLELPASLPILLGGLRVGVTLSVIGALVGEFVQPRSLGLGFMLVTARYQFNTPLVFVILITLAALALSMYALVAIAERRLLFWKEER
ncbi:MAG TPA: ABC transporter permease [Anaerolineae bacterium]|nr:ABC transporter permease [Anaerolineae bacterium]